MKSPTPPLDVSVLRGLLALARDRARAAPLIVQLKSGQRRWEELTPRERRELGAPLIDLLRGKSLGSRREEPKSMVKLAELARDLAQQLSCHRYGRKVVADLRARAWAELGNAYRVADDFDRAAEAFAGAFGWLERGARLPQQVGLIGRLYAHLLADQRRFREAADLLEQAAAVYRGLGDQDTLARILVALGMVRGDANEPERAIFVFFQALAILDPESEQRLPAVHGLARNLVMAGLHEQARAVLEKNRRLYSRSGKLHGIRLRWLEAKIAFAVGELGGAEAKLNVSRLAFRRADQNLDSALVSLDLALVYVRQERRRETVWLIGDLVRTFLSLGISREAIASLLQLKQSCEHRRSAEALRAQIEIIAAMVGELQRSRPRRALR